MILTKLKKITKKNLPSTAVLRITTRMSSILVFKLVRIPNYWSSMVRLGVLILDMGFRFNIAAAENKIL